LLPGCGRQEEKPSRVKLSAGRIGSSLIDPNSLAVAFPILNQGSADATDVQATAITLQTASLVAPASLPLSVGAIAADSEGIIQATFKGTFSPANPYVVKIEGTFKEEGATHKFAVEGSLQVPPTSPGSAESGDGTSPANKTSGAKYPAQPPNFGKEVNEGHAWKVPKGQERPAPPPPQESVPQPAPKEDPPPINFFTNVNIGMSGSTVNEPSGGVGGKVIFETYNWSAAYSTNGGSSFTQVDPTTIFPNGADGGFCCDQIVEYAASIDRIIWIMQFSKGSNGENRYRIAAASPHDIQTSNGTAWTYWDITSAQIKDTGDWLDYPDASIGDKSLYLSFDEVGSGGRVIVRIPLSEIKAGSTIHWRYTNHSDSPMAYGGHLTQNTRDEIFWAGHNNTSSIRVFSWKESSNTYFWQDVSIGSWQNNTLSSSTPDGNDWLTKLQNFPGNAILGATRLTGKKGTHAVGDQVWLGWTASSGGHFKQAQVQWVSLDRSNNFSVINQSQVWNGSYAFAYPAFSSNSDGELGMSLEYGGGGNYENHVCGFWGDFIVYITTSSDLGTTRFGDYVTIRQNAANPRRFDAFGYGLHKTGTKTETRYMQFGRP
jgi:hypothetical protein